MEETEYEKTLRQYQLLAGLESPKAMMKPELAECSYCLEEVPVGELDDNGECLACSSYYDDEGEYADSDTEEPLSSMPNRTIDLDAATKMYDKLVGMSNEQPSIADTRDSLKQIKSSKFKNHLK